MQIVHPICSFYLEEQVYKTDAITLEKNDLKFTWCNILFCLGLSSKMGHTVPLLQTSSPQKIQIKP